MLPCSCRSTGCRRSRCSTPSPLSTPPGPSSETTVLQTSRRSKNHLFFFISGLEIFFYLIFSQYYVFWAFMSKSVLHVLVLYITCGQFAKKKELYSINFFLLSFISFLFSECRLSLCQFLSLNYLSPSSFFSFQVVSLYQIV